MKIAHNFRHPYMALTLRDFWGRWNITVVEWIGRYVFRTKGEPMAEHGILTGALLIFMAGLWHGMTVQFALWALLHGGAFALESRAFRRIDRSPQSGFAIPALRFLMTQGFVIVTANLLG
jgi:alginate O-acetyltransferase complex protein AlgI